MRLSELEQMIGEELAEQMVLLCGGKKLPSMWELDKKNRDRNVWMMWVNGKSMRLIASELGIGFITVFRIIRRRKQSNYRAEDES